MAFTVSHAAVAPILHRLTRGQLPLAALALGSMTPDLLRLFGVMSYFGHTWHGVVSIDLVVGLGACALWYTIYRPFIYAACGRMVGKESNQNTWLKQTLLIVLALLIGSATHLIWDGFTHNDFRRFEWSAPFLERTMQMPFIGTPMPLYHWLQYVTSFLALAWLFGLIQPIFNAPVLPFTQVFIHARTFARAVIFVALLGGVLATIAQMKAIGVDDAHVTYFAIGQVSIAFARSFGMILTLGSLMYWFIFYHRAEFAACDELSNKA